MKNDLNEQDNLAVNRDCNKRKKAESSLIETNEIFSLLVNAVSEYAIFSLDTEGYIQTWNSGAQRLKGYLPSEIIGTHFSRFYTKKDIDRKHPQFELAEAIKNGAYQEEGWRIRKDGTLFWASVVITALRDKENKLRGFAKVTRDLTERKNAEDELYKANSMLEQRVRDRTKELHDAQASAIKAVKIRDEFLSIASHELNTPLTSLKLQIQMRKRQLMKGMSFTIENFQKMVHSDEKQISRLGRLIDDMLDISKLNSGKFIFDLERTDLGLLVEDVLSRFSFQFEEAGIQITFNQAQEVIGVWDRYRIEQVITNLLTNTLKYGDNKPVEINISRIKDNAIIKIKDNGIGISKDNQHRIFQQYERAVSANSISGLGLGLYIVKEIIENHKGNISVESELGKGSTFTIILPLT